MYFPQSLSKYLLDNTTAEIYSRGLEYALRNKVRNFTEEAKKIRATVTGTKNYDVEIRQGQKYYKGYCTCPYAQSNDDYCKHIIALAVFYDSQRNTSLPTEKEIEELCIEVDRTFWPNIRKMYDDPLSADLQLLATATDYGSWVRPHARLPLSSTVTPKNHTLTVKEVHSGLRKIARLETRTRYDPYFCAGEVSAILSKIYDDILSCFKQFNDDVVSDVFIECVEFYYNDYLQMIDGSDGVWQIPQARVIKLFDLLKQRLNNPEKLEDIREALNEKIEGWGDIFDDLGVTNKQ